MNRQSIWHKQERGEGGPRNLLGADCAAYWVLWEPVVGVFRSIGVKRTAVGARAADDISVIRRVPRVRYELLSLFPTEPEPSQTSSVASIAPHDGFVFPLDNCLYALKAAALAGSCSACSSSRFSKIFSAIFAAAMSLVTTQTSK
jgi:hypothetical protein